MVRQCWRIGTISIGRNNGSSNTGIVVGAGSKLITVPNGSNSSLPTNNCITIGLGSATARNNDLTVYDGGLYRVQWRLPLRPRRDLYEHLISYGRGGSHEHWLRNHSSLKFSGNEQFDRRIKRGIHLQRNVASGRRANTLACLGQGISHLQQSIRRVTDDDEVSEYHHPIRYSDNQRGHHQCRQRHKTFSVLSLAAPAGPASLMTITNGASCYRAGHHRRKQFV